MELDDSNWKQEYLSWKPVSKKQKELLENGPKGLSQAWTDYVIEDLNELIIDNGAEYVLQNLDPKAKQLLIDYIKDTKPSSYEYELNKSTGEVEKKFNGS